jgi:alpha-tubulin suppressor-like RCC1 family protein
MQRLARRLLLAGGAMAILSLTACGGSAPRTGAGPSGSQAGAAGAAGAGAAGAGAAGAGAAGAAGAPGAGAAGAPRPHAHPGRRDTAPIAQIAAGGYAGYALLGDGTVWAWGDDLEGQIGSARRSGLTASPIEVGGIPRIVQIAAGANTAYALDRRGAIWAWGDDSQDELGDSGSVSRHAPLRVRAPTGVIALAAGMYAGYALRRDGVVWAWGDDGVGQLGGVGAEVTRGRPGPVQQLTGVVAIAAGASNAYGLRRDGTVWAWGDDSLGELGAGGCRVRQTRAADGSHCPATGTPVEIRGLTRVRAIAAGANTGYALRADGTVWAWGDSTSGALGSATARPFAVWPVRVSAPSDVVSIAAGSGSAYAVLRDGSVLAWGAGSQGQLGDGSLTDRVSPAPVQRLAGAVAIAAGGAMAYGLDRHGRLWAWGSGSYGQLGNGSTLTIDRPAAVVPFTLPPPPKLPSFLAPSSQLVAEREAAEAQ